MTDLPAVTVEDEDPLAHVGEEADAPVDTGAPEAAGPPFADHPVTADAPEARPWRVATCLDVLLAEVDARWPRRDRASDGSIGDASHVGEGWTKSDHNPWVVKAGVGIVRARDFDSDGISAAWLAEHLRQLGASGDSRLNPNGYVIFNRRIASADHGWTWRVYTGSDPHTGHIHFSVTTASAGFDRTGAWGVKAAPAPVPPPHRHVMPLLREGDVHPAVRDLQGHLNAWRANRQFTPLLPTDGFFRADTREALRTFQKNYRLTVDGVCGPQTWAKVHAITKGAVLWH